MKIGEVFRYARPYSENPEEIDGLRNFFAATKTSANTKMLLEAGIQAPAPVVTPDSTRVPAILIRSSPHKVGSNLPWQDVFRPDQGQIRYFGDNKNPGKDPIECKGNRLLIDQFKLHTSSLKNDRNKACPIICFRSVPFHGRQKGQVEFQGACLVERVERISQVSPETGLPFVNYVFDFLVLELLKENEQFDWRWVDDRRNGRFSDTDAARYAPASWTRWISQGSVSFGSVRRLVSKQSIVKRHEQQPPLGSREAEILNEIYQFYEKKKHRFEVLPATQSCAVPYFYRGVHTASRLGYSGQFGQWHRLRRTTRYWQRVCMHKIGGAWTSEV